MCSEGMCRPPVLHGVRSIFICKAHLGLCERSPSCCGNVVSCAANFERNRSLAEAQIQEIEWMVVWVDKILEEGQCGKSVLPDLRMLAFHLFDIES